MRAVIRSSVVLVLALVCAVTREASAQSPWVEVKSPRFTVLSDGGERRARDVAWQFEQFRSAIELGWPWARVQLDRPVVILAAKDESSMRALLPGFWEQRGGSRPAGLFVSGPDASYIIIRSDIRESDSSSTNPYRTPYWSYSAMMLNAAFGGRLPLWFRIGMAEVLSNTIVREKEVRFGLPLDSHLRVLQEPRLSLRDLMAIDASSSYFKDSGSRSRYDAQAWALMHYMLYGRPEAQESAVNRLSALLLNGTPSEAAVTQVFGTAESLQAAYLRYSEQRVFQYAIMRTDEKVTPEALAARPVTPAESAARIAALHVVLDRPKEAQELIERARKADPSSPLSYEVEALLLDKGGKRTETLAALTKAAELKSNNAYAHFRRATLLWNPDASGEALAPVEAALRRTIEIDPTHARAHAALSEILVRGSQPQEAVALAARATQLQPREAYARLALGWALYRNGQRDAARGHAMTAQSLASADDERAQAKELLEALSR